MKPENRLSGRKIQLIKYAGAASFSPRGESKDIMKKKTLFRTLAFILAAAVMPVFAGCVGNPEDTGAGSSEALPEVTTEAEPSEIRYTGGENAYTIIRSSYAGTFEVEAGKKLNSTLKNSSLGWNGTIMEDFVAGKRKGDIVDVDAYEIVLGNTNRSEGKAVFDTLSGNQYKICVSGKKLLIIGATEYATSIATDLFIDTFVKEGKMSVPADFVLEGSAGSESGDDEIRVMSWNLGCAVGVAKDCLTVIERYQPDVLSFQESNADIHSSVFMEYIKSHKNFRFAMQRHPGKSTVVYTPIVYNSDKLTLIEAGVEWLDGRFTGTNTKSLAWAVFDDVNGSRFCMINFHGAVCSASYKGYENMSDSERSAIAAAWRLDNVRQILEVRDRLYTKYGTMPTTVNGDCNFNSSSEPYKKLVEAGFAEAELTAAKIVKSGYKTSYSYGKKPGTGLSIDHIFGENGILFMTYDVIIDDEAFTGSDHYPIIADMRITPEIK